MKLADIETERYYTAKLVGGTTDTVRVERIADPRWEGDRARVVVSRWQARGRFEARLAPVALSGPITPTPAFLRIAAIMEEA